MGIGITGPTGPTGAPGKKGTDGANGGNGFDGTTGAPGGPGPAGTTGAPGGPGPAGTTGLPGGPGPAGTTGLPGGPGPAGTTGLPGGVGPAGTTGLPGGVGPAGTTGFPGGSGPAGTTGFPGGVGPAGTTGAPGGPGAAGTTGAPGSPGSPGATGSISAIFGTFVSGSSTLASAPNTAIASFQRTNTDPGELIGLTGANNNTFTLPGGHMYYISYQASIRYTATTAPGLALYYEGSVDNSSIFYSGAIGDPTRLISPVSVVRIIDATNGPITDLQVVLRDQGTSTATNVQTVTQAFQYAAVTIFALY